MPKVPTLPERRPEGQALVLYESPKPLYKTGKSYALFSVYAERDPGALTLILTYPGAGYVGASHKFREGQEAVARILNGKVTLEIREVS